MSGEERQTQSPHQGLPGSLSEKMSAWGGWSSFNLQYKGIKRLLPTGQKGTEERKERDKGRMKGGRGKVKELNSKEHRGLKSSGSEGEKCEVACTEKGLWPMAWLCFFTLSTHTSGCFRPGNLLCLALLIFRGKGVGGGSRR